MKCKFVGLLICCFIILTSVLIACAPVSPPEAKPAAAAVTAEKPAAKTALTPSDADDALHETAGTIYEWWYWDATFDNGYSMSTSWGISDPSFVNSKETPDIIQFSIYDPLGKKTNVDAPFAAKDITASETSCDVTMGTNHLKGSIPRYDIEFRDKDLGCKLTFESVVTEGFRKPPDGVSYFTRQPDRWIGWVVAQPRAKVTGTLILDGKEIPVTGVGYHDHNWGNIALTEMYSYWYWGRIFLPDYTIIYSIAQMTDALGKKPSSVILAYKGEKLVGLTTDVTAEGSDFMPDKLTGAQYPQTLIIRPQGQTIKGTITHKLNHLVEALLLWGAEEGKGHAYFRFLSDCDIKLDVAGDKIDVKTSVLHEYLIP